MAAVVDPSTDFAFTVTFGAMVAGVFYSMRAGALPPEWGFPMSNMSAATALLLCCLGVLPTIAAVKRASAVVGCALSRTLLRHLGDPLSKTKTLRKFEAQMWQLFIHVSMSLLELWILFVEGGGEPWLSEPHTLWQPLARLQVNKPSVHALYLLQLAIWMATCFSHRFIEERQKDYVMMFIHHLVTIGLVWGSYVFNYVRVGTIVLVLHDTSDVVADLLKACNYLKLEGARGLFLVEINFVLLLLSWWYTRLYYLPLHVVWRAIVIGLREVCTAPGHVGMEAFTRAAGSEFTRGHQRGAALGDGSFDLLASLRALPFPPNIPLYWTATSLLSLIHI